MADVINMADRSGNAMMVSPEQALQDAIKDIGKYGAFKDGTKLLILALDDTDNQYSVSWIQAGMRMSECLALCEVARTKFLRAMNHI